MEAVAAFGLAANILQFVEVTGRLISSARELSQQGAKSEYVELEAIAQQLRGLAKGIHPPQDGDDDEDPAHTHTGGGLGKLATSSIEIANELLGALDSLKLRGGKHKWKSFHQALRTVWKAGQIEDLQKRMDKLSKALNSELIASQQRRIFRKLDLLAAHNLRLDAARAKDIQDLRDRLHGAYDDLKKELRRDESRRAPMSALLHVAEKEVQYSAEQAVLDKLRFDTIDDRYEGIRLAHSKTFCWIFGTQLEKDAPPSSFSEWLASAEDLFWVSGKPGSGKSTLMKYLCLHRETRRRLQTWAQGNRLIMADFFFWNAAKQSLQKSQQGLLRSLLYQILRQSPELIERIYPDIGHTQLQRHSSTASHPGTWNRTLQVPSLATSVPGLISVLRRACELLAASNEKCCFFIDGLDEFEGQSKDIIDLIGILRSIPNVKICVSSRPWNEFEDKFGQCGSRKLYMQDLTREDIRKYVCDAFENDVNYHELEEDGAGRNLINEIIEAAQGVFLWVILVVRSFQEGLINGDRIKDLQVRLRQLPRDLNEYFEKILFSDVPEFYQQQSARIFAAALNAHGPLPLMTYWLMEQGDADYACELEIGPPLNVQQATKRHKQMRKRLNACCKGLLEVRSLPSTSDESMLSYSIHFEGKVDFLHRTAKDFLARAETQASLATWDPQAPGTDVVICGAILSQMKTAPQGRRCFTLGGERSIPNLLDLFLSHCRALHDNPGSDCEPALLERFLDQLDATLRGHEKVIGYKFYHTVLLSLVHEGFGKSYDLTPASTTLLRVCAKYGLCRYVDRELGSRPNEPLLLSQLLRIAVQGADRPMVQVLLRGGANPNDQVSRDQSNWELLLRDVHKNSGSVSLPEERGSSLYSIIQDLLDSGADVAASFNLTGQLLSSHEILRRALPQEYMACIEHFFVDPRHAKDVPHNLAAVDLGQSHGDFIVLHQARSDLGVIDLDISVDPKQAKSVSNSLAAVDLGQSLHREASPVVGAFARTRFSRLSSWPFGLLGKGSQS
ncbi:hypothetical protein RB597_001950 [Gaeumannomyces tritici]